MAIAYNSTSSIDDSGATSSTTLSWSHTCNAADKKLIVCVGGRASISGVTYNGVAMTLVANQFDTYEYNAVYYLDNPPTGSAYTITATYSASTGYRMGAAVGISGCSTGVGANGVGSNFYSGTSPQTATANLTTQSNNSHILACGWHNNIGGNGVTYGSGQTTIVSNTAGTPGFIIQYKNTTTAGANSVSISITTAANVAEIAGEIKLRGTAFTQTLTETLALTDSLLKAITKPFTETLTLTDILTRQTTKPLSETLSLTDTLLKALQRTFTETVSLTDTLNKTATKVFNEVVSLTDQFTKAVGKLFTETFSLTDTFSRIGVFFRTLTETITVTDTYTKTAYRTFTETITLTDTLKILLNGLANWYNDKFTKRNNYYSDTHALQNSSYFDTHSAQNNTYQDKV